MEEPQREFRGVWIPKEIWLDDRLSALDKVLMVEIESLSHGDMGCVKSNEALAKFCHCSEKSVSSSIARLKEYGLVCVESFDGRRRVLRSCLAIISKQPRNIYEADSQIVQGTYIDRYNKEINNEEYIYMPKAKKPRKAKPFVPPTLDEVRTHVTEKGYHFSAQEFFAYYEASGWHFASGKPVKSWKQCCVTWENNWKKRPHREQPSPEVYDAYSEDTWADVERRG